MLENKVKSIYRKSIQKMKSILKKKVMKKLERQKKTEDNKNFNF